MSKQTEALKLALEGLEKWHFDKDPRGADQYITAIREALAERCVCGEPDTPGTHRTDGPCLAEDPAQQEPVAWYHAEDYKTHFTSIPSKDLIESGYWKPLYTSPPADRKPLTDEEIHKMTVLMGINPEWKAEMEIVRSVVRNLEAKLREKNA